MEETKSQLVCSIDPVIFHVDLADRQGLVSAPSALKSVQISGSQSPVPPLHLTSAWTFEQARSLERRRGWVRSVLPHCLVPPLIANASRAGFKYALTLASFSAPVLVLTTTLVPGPATTNLTTAMKPVIAVPATLALVYRAWSRRSLTPAGILAAALTAAAHAYHPWNLPFALLCIFFLAGTRVTKVGGSGGGGIGRPGEFRANDKCRSRKM